MYIMCYLLFQIPLNFVDADLRVTTVAIITVGKGWSEIELFCIISVLVSYYTV